MYSPGMNNSSAALLIVSMTMAVCPNVMVPVVVYSLGQHVVAGVAAAVVGSKNPEGKLLS